jgi:Xaa-Pro aminopeptidase
VSRVRPATGAFSAAEHEARLSRVRELMTSDEHDLDALVVTSPENIYYLIGLTHQGYFAFTMLVAEGRRAESAHKADGGGHHQPTGARCRPHRLQR